MAEILEIKNYQYHIFSSRPSGIKGVVSCKTSNDKTVNIHFSAEDQGILEAKVLDNGNFILYYSYSEMPAVIDMLRNEKPVYLVYVPEGKNNTRLASGQEVIGEGEIS